MAKVFVTRKIPGDHIERLRESGCEVEVSEFDRALTPEELLEKVKDIDGLLCLLTDRIDEDLMDAAGPQLKVIANYAVGFDNINVEAATKRGIVVCNTLSEVINEAVAEHTWALILALSRRIVEADEAIRRGAYKGWEPDIFLGLGLSGKTLGIIGLGRIGTMVARRAKGFNMDVIYNKKTPDPEIEKELDVKFSDLNSLLALSDVVTLHLPLTQETRHLINEGSLAKMKKGSYLINTSRGQIVDEHALVRFLRDGSLSGAALDVFEDEPNINPELIGMQNVVLTPHIASATLEARDEMGKLAVKGIRESLSGQKPINIVNEKVWNIRRK